MHPTDQTQTEELLEQSAWLRRLAKSLVADPGVAEDAAQQALVAAHQKQPGASRGWLGSVLRNALRQAQRSRMRRADHEAQAAAGAIDERSATETVALLETQRGVVEAVRRLDEPYRTTITLRFLEELPARDVARRMGVPVKTVHTRVERGLARLRVSLDQAYGGHSAWVAVFAPLAERAKGGALLGTLGSGGLLMGTIWKLGGTAAVLALLAVTAHRVANEPADPGLQLVVADGEGVRAASPPPSAERPSVTETVRTRAIVPDTAPADSLTVVASPVEPETFVGRVEDIDGNRIGGLDVVFEATTLDESEAGVDERTARCDANGEYEMELRPVRGRLKASGRGFATLIAPGISGELPPEPPVIVVGPEQSYAGRVVDTEGLSVSEAQVKVFLSEAMVGRLRLGLFGGLAPIASGRSDADGHFDLGSFGSQEDHRVTVTARGFMDHEFVLPPESKHDLQVELRRFQQGADMISGVVLDERGNPSEGARVSLGGTVTRTNALGEFVLDPKTSETRDRVTAVARGSLPASLDIAELSEGERQRLLLVLGGPPKVIMGTVLDVDGAPLANAPVWSFDAEFFGMETREFGDVSMLTTTNVEDLIAGRASPGIQTRTDENGQFELSGLLDHVYSLHALHPVTLESVRMERVPAGSNRVRLQFSGSEERARVCGRVIFRSGKPVTTAFIRVHRSIPRPGERPGHRSADQEFGAATDSQGRFVFEELAVRGTSLLLNGEGIGAAQTIALDQAEDFGDLEFVVSEMCHLRVTLSTDAELADAFEILDAKGQRLNLSFLSGSITLGSQAISFSEGASPLVQTDDSAATLVLFKGGSELRRVPLELQGGQVNEIQF